ncbi:MAG: hypothetical protein FVQ80_00230 [Planctomycetes bacterium]|nr:hypothetical protein [Planctomycetota bacterium]
METNILGFFIGGLFGAGLFLAGLADPDKIVGTLRLKDLHAMKTIAVFIIAGMAGVWFLEAAGVVHLGVKPAHIVSGLVGGAVLGIGFGITGYCPGTGLACAAAGRIDALVTVLGMFVGALAYILIYPYVLEPLDAIGNYGKVTLMDVTGIGRGVFVLVIVLSVTGILWFSSRKKPA